MPHLSIHLLAILSFISVSKAEQATLWTQIYGEPVDLAFSGITTFAHLPHIPCLTVSDPLDIAIIGYPFDTAVSYRPGARFGPHGIRDGSRRLRPVNGWSMHWRNNPYDGSVTLYDCGDVPITPYDNSIALTEMEVAYNTLLDRPVVNNENLPFTKDLQGNVHPLILTLGGDHTIVLPILRSLHRHYGPITVLHFDSHIDTWPPSRIPSSNTPISQITHGTFFWKASTEGLIANNSVHAGIRSKFSGPLDLEHDERVGFELITTDDIDDIGTLGIIERIHRRVGNAPLYLSLDIDVVDPAFAPATGTPEPGGWSMREIKRILRGLTGLNLVGADIVEVAPVYDHADITSIAAADIAHEILSLFLAGRKGDTISPVVPISPHIEL